jgi:hypothetical protein
MLQLCLIELGLSISCISKAQTPFLECRVYGSSTVVSGDANLHLVYISTCLSTANVSHWQFAHLLCVERLAAARMTMEIWVTHLVTL